MAFAPAAWAQATACSDTANVGWSVDHTAVTVTGVHVEVPGCADGEWVGIELITDDGDVPDDGPLTSEVAGEVADFDVSELGLRIEPVTGIRVFLLLDGDPVPVIVITVEQRFFASSGNEQNGLMQVTDLQITTGSTYLVPPAPTGYTGVACDDVNFEVPVGVIDQGSGEFTADEPGVHVVCYQLVPGTPGGPGPGGPTVDEPEVLGETIGEEDESDASADLENNTTSKDDVATSEPDQTEDEVSQITDRSDGRSADDERPQGNLGALARTGFDAAGIFLVGMVLVIVGGSLARWRRART